MQRTDGALVSASATRYLPTDRLTQCTDSVIYLSSFKKLIVSFAISERIGEAIPNTTVQRCI